MARRIGILLATAKEERDVLLAFFSTSYVAKYLNTKRFFRPFKSPPHSNNEMLGLILIQAVRNIMYKNGNIPHVDMW